MKNKDKQKTGQIKANKNKSKNVSNKKYTSWKS